MVCVCFFSEWKVALVSLALRACAGAVVVQGFKEKVSFGFRSGKVAVSRLVCDHSLVW